MAVPTSSAVLLLHNGHGGFPIAAPGGLSPSAAHALSYDARTDEFEEMGGCDREATERDLEFAERRRISDEAEGHLDYAARRGAWEGRAGTMAEDCSYWGQNGPLTREEIERDMLACGGCYLKSVVSVDRRYAAELKLDSKAAFEDLLRSNWQDMMAAAGVAGRASDVHWYACYHTDAPNSLHVHVATWAADGRIGEGWHPSARATREQKAMLYRDAYAQVRLQRDLEKDYYRMLLPRLAAAEMGGRVREADAQRLRAKAERAGVEEVPLRRTLDESGMAEVGRRADAVSARLGEGRGLKARDWKLQSDAGKVVAAIRRNSAAFDTALARYRQLVEAGADMAGLAVSERGHDPSKTPTSKAARERAAAAGEIARRERERFVRREMDDLMRRVRNQVIRSTDPEGGARELARSELGKVRHRLLTESLTPGKIGLPPEAEARLREIYGAAARDGGVPRGLADEAARIVASSDAAARAAAEAASRVVDASGGAVSAQAALSAVKGQMRPCLTSAARWRLSDGRMAPSHAPSGRGAPRWSRDAQARPQPASPSTRAQDGQGRAERERPGEAVLGPAGIVASVAAAIVRERGEGETGGRAGKRAAKGTGPELAGQPEERTR